jgi:hypothetical protein
MTAELAFLAGFALSVLAVCVPTLLLYALGECERAERERLEALR